MARKAKKKNIGPHKYQRGNRWYGDFRQYEAVGGGREPLAEPGSKWGTKDEEIAETLFVKRLNELHDKKRKRAGVPQEDKTTTLAKLVQHHLLKKDKAGKTSYSHIRDLEQRLDVAIEYFGEGRDPRTIEAAEVGAWAENLAKDGTRKPGTVRHYLNALSGLYKRAQEGLWVDTGYNPVAALVEKPSGWRRCEAEFMEMADAALYLEAARLLGGQDRLMPGLAGNRVRAMPGWYPTFAAFLLTGGRQSEVMGLDVDDVSFDRGEIRFRPNAHRRLKTLTSVRTVPLWPQLREILQEWMYGGETPRASGLLFASSTGAMVGNLRQSLDATARLCGIEGGKLRTRRFRHTYCSARLQTVQRILKPGGDPSDENAWEYIEVSKFQVQKEMGHGGSQLVDRIYGHAHRNPIRSDVVEYRVEKHQEMLGDRLRSLAANAGTAP